MNPVTKIYGAGGAGIDLVNKFAMDKTEGFCAFEKYFLDTSTSNVPDGADNFYQVRGMNGAGKNRETTYREAHNQVSEMLKTCKPGTFNIIVHSLAGGSGSVIGPLLAAELARRGIPAISLYVGSSVSLKETENSYKTMATYKGLNKSVKRPMVVEGFFNVSDESKVNRVNIGLRHNVDEYVHRAIRHLLLLASEEHHGLDREDVTNMVFYDNVTDFSGRVTELITGTDTERLEGLRGKIVGKCALVPSPETNIIDLGEAYNCDGEYPEGIETKEAFYFVTVPGVHETRMAQLKKEMEEHTARLNQLFEETESALDDDTEDDGFVV